MKLFHKHAAGPDLNNDLFPDKKEVKSQFSPLLFGVSLVFHVALFAVFFLIQTLSPPIVELPMVKVRLVSLDTVAVPGEESFEDSPDLSENFVVSDPTVEKPPPVMVSEKPVAQDPVPSVPEVPPDSVPEPSDAIDSEPVMEIPVKIPMVEKKPVIKKEIVPPPPSAPVKTSPVESTAPEQKVSLKKKTYRPEAVLASAKKQIAQSVEKQDENSIDTALSRLRKKVAGQTNAKGGLFGAQGGPVGGSSDSTRAIDLYNLELMYRIQKNWAFNRQLAGNNDNMEVRILIKILKSGQIRDIWFETRSGNRFLDDSALKAVRKSNPLSPLPRGYDTYDVGLIFTPAGLM